MDVVADLPADAQAAEPVQQGDRLLDHLPHTQATEPPGRRSRPNRIPSGALKARHQESIGLAQAWGGGLVASVDGMRFVVPVPSVYARHAGLLDQSVMMTSRWIHCVLCAD